METGERDELRDRDDMLLAIDQGTTGSTCLLLDDNLQVLGRANREFEQHFPHPGHVEHDPEQIWASVVQSIAEALAQTGREASSIKAIGVTNQRETSLVWERSAGKPVHRAIVWQDRRTTGKCQSLRQAGHAERVRVRTGLVLDPYFSATKIAWILDTVPGAREAALRGELAAGTIDTFLVWRLTGGEQHLTEPSNASRTLLWPLDAKAQAGAQATPTETQGWDEEMCELFEVPPSLLPAVRPSNDHFGVTKGVPGLPDGIPIHGIAGDQQAALFGQACFSPGQAKCTYGTGAFAVLNTGSSPVHSRHQLLSSVAWQLDDETTYCLEGSAFMAGAVVQWLRDGLELIESAPAIEALARQVHGSDGVVLVPGHAGLGAPHWRPEARGLIRGLTRGTTKAHLARAALEGIALQCCDLLEAMAADTGRALAELRVDGGATKNELLMQIQADLLGAPLKRPELVESTALGATFLAGLGAGVWSDTDELGAAWRCAREFIPAPDAEQRYTTLKQLWAEAIASA